MERKTRWTWTVGGSRELTDSAPRNAPEPWLAGCRWLESCFCRLRAGPLSSSQRNGDAVRIKEDTYIRRVTVLWTEGVAKMTRTKHKSMARY